MAGVKDRRRLAPGEAAALAALRLQLAKEVQEAEADAGPLPLWHDDQPAGARLDALALVHGRDGQVDGELAVDRPDVIGGPDHARQLQIVMRLKQRPVRAVRLPDFEIEARSPKRPPREAALRCVKGPVGLDPFDDVVVRGKQDDPLALGAPPGLGEGERAELGDLTVNDRGELVDDRLARGLDHQARQVGAELLAVGEDRIGPEPSRNRAEPDRAQRRRHVVERARGRDRVDDRLVVRPGRLPEGRGLAEDEPADRGLARAGRPDHDADLPVAGQVELGVKGEIAAGFGVEQGFDPRGAVAVEIRAAVADGDPHVVTTLTVSPSPLRRS